MMGISNIFILKFTITIGIIFFISSNVNARQNAFMQSGELTSIPIGHYEFCNNRPSECSTRTHGDIRVKLTQKNWDTLLQTNYKINHTIAAVTDYDLYGNEEVWTYPQYAGDCEDYVLQKRRELMTLGWPAASLLITVVLQPNGEGHAVLTVRTDRGDFILDNLQDRVMVWSETPYTYIKRQSKNHTGKWETIKSQRVSAVGSIKR